MKFLTVPADGGSHETLMPLIKNKKFNLFSNCYNFNDWESYLKAEKFDGVVLSTSRSNAGAQLEFDCLFAANRLDLFTAVIEDYQFNFQPKKALKINLLLVENKTIKDCYASSFRNLVDVVDEGALIRYSGLTSQNYSLVPQGSKILWVGQPETDPSIKVLERLLPILRKHNLLLYFKAHPRDIGYSSANRYQFFFDKFKGNIFDVSSLSVEQCMALVPSLLITRFSSMAITAGHYGIPSLHVLYEDIEYRYYRKMYTNQAPMICQMEASFLIKSEKDSEQVLLRATFDAKARKIIFQNFFKHYRKNRDYSHTVINKIIAEASRFKNEKS